MIYKNSTLIRSIIALSFLLNTVACSNSRGNGIYKRKTEYNKSKDKEYESNRLFGNEKNRKNFVEEETQKADETIEKLKKMDDDTWKQA